MAITSKSVYRRFTPEEREMFERAKREVEEDLPWIKDRMRASSRRESAVQDLLWSLHTARVEADMTLEQLDERTGLGMRTLAEIDHGVNADPSIETLMEIAEAVGVRLRVEIERKAEAVEAVEDVPAVGGVERQSEAA